ncbi:MAG TPA: hypothetical protein VII63_10685 [Caulobacteraceae bacterium]
MIARAPKTGIGAVGVGVAVIVEAHAVARLSTRLFQDRCLTAAAGLAGLLECRTAQDLLAAQAGLICEDLDLVRGGCEQLSEIIARAAGDTVRSLPVETHNVGPTLA